LFLTNDNDGGGFDLEGLIFDLDGTLIDSIEVYYTMMKTVFEGLCWPKVPRKIMRKAIKDDGFELGFVAPQEAREIRKQEDHRFLPFRHSER